MANHGTIYSHNTNIYPTIRTRRIHISQTDGNTIKIRVDYSLNLKRPNASLFGEGPDVFSEFLNDRENHSKINVSFMVLDQRNSSLITSLFRYQDQQMRISALSNQIWVDPRFALLNETNGWQRVQLKDILLQSADRQQYTTVSDMGGETNYETHNYIEIEYNARGVLPQPGQSSIFSEVSSRLEDSGEGELLREMHLLCFLEIPYQDYIGDENIAVQEIKTIPLTETVYDKLLEPTGTGAVRPPQNRKAFFIDDPTANYASINGRPYSGPAFFNDDESRWYAGALTNVGPKLKVRTLINTKVTVDAPPLSSTTELPHLNHSMPSRAGQDLESYIRGNHNTAHFFLGEFRRAKMMVDASLTAMSRERKSIIEPWSYNHTWITRADEDEQLNNSYNCIFGIKYYDLIKNNTSFGGLMDYHLQRDTRSSRELVEDIFRKTKILNLKIIRRRLSNEAYAFNDQDSKVYVDFSENQENKIILETSDSAEEGAPTLISVENDSASIEEVVLSLDGDGEENEINEFVQAEISEGTFKLDERKKTRSFMIKDYELFYNLDSGMYTYDISVTFKDGFRDIIEEHIRLLRERIQETTEEVTELSAAVVRGPDSAIEQGYYDYNLRAFYNVTQAQSDSIKRKFVNLITRIRETSFLMSGDRPFSDVAGAAPLANETISRLDPLRQTTRIEDMQFFLDGANSILRNLEELLERAFLKQKVARPTSYVEVHVPNARATNSSIVTVSAKTGIIHDATETLRLCSDYGLNDALTFNAFLDRIRREALVNSGGLPDLPNTNIITDFPTPFGDIRPPIDQDISFNVELMEPVQFLTIDTPRLRIREDLVKFRQPLGPSQPLMDTNPVRTPVTRPADEPISGRPSAPFVTPRATVKITKNDFMKSNAVQKSIKETRILTMMTKESHISGLAFKDPVYDARFLPGMVAGIDTSFGNRPLSSNGIEDIANYAVNYLPIDSSLMSEDLKKALIDNLIESNDEEHFTTRIRNNYKELSDVRESLGKVYDVFNRLIALNNLSIKAGLFLKDEEARFKTGATKNKASAIAQLAKGPFENKKAQFTTFDIKGNTTYHNSGVANKMQTFSQKPVMKNNVKKGNLKNVKLFKLNTINNDDNIGNVNNAILLERF